MTNWLKFGMILTCVLLGACSNMPLSTLYKMTQINPLTLTPKTIVVAVISPQNVAVQNSDVVLKVNFRSDVPEMNFNNRYFLQVDPNYDVPSDISDELSSGNKVTILRLSAADAQQMATRLAQIRQYRVNHNEGAGSMGLDLISACSISHTLAKDAHFSLFVKLNETDNFFPFLEDLGVEDLQQFLICDKH